jgi:hypothetical protein
MNIRLATAASAFAMAAAVSAPAMANDQAALIATGTTIALTAVDAPSDVAGVADAAMAADAAPIVITAASATTGTASTTALALDSAAVTAAVQAATPASEKRSESFTVVLNQDAFFGFYPTFNALIPVSDTVDLSVYGILWTTPDFGTGAPSGSDLWTEFGIGANFHMMDGALTVKPQFGILNGALLSGGAAGGTGGNVFDGVVPNLTVNYSDDTFELEYYGGYYAAVRNRNTQGLDFLHTWINAGYKFTSNFSAGAHYELLSLTRAAGGGATNIYHWVGPYVQFSTDNGFFARFTGGWDVGQGNTGDFYKLAVGFSF